MKPSDPLKVKFDWCCDKETVKYHMHNHVKILTNLKSGGDQIPIKLFSAGKSPGSLTSSPTFKSKWKIKHIIQFMAVAGLVQPKYYNASNKDAIEVEYLGYRAYIKPPRDINNLILNQVSISDGENLAKGTIEKAYFQWVSPVDATHEPTFKHRMINEVFNPYRSQNWKGVEYEYQERIDNNKKVYGDNVNNNNNNSGNKGDVEDIDTSELKIEQDDEFLKDNGEGDEYVTMGFETNLPKGLIIGSMVIFLAGILIFINWK